MPEKAPSNSPTARSLRENKRLRTHAAIQQHATRLVLERGFDNVTVEDICNEVGISPRTFFNYFPSKDVAVLGPEPRVPGVDVNDWFAGTHHAVADQPTLIFRVLTLMFDLIADELRSENYSAEIVTQRRAIKESNPTLARVYFAKYHVMHDKVEGCLTKFLNDNPEHRHLPGTQLTVRREASLIVATVLAALSNGIKHWQMTDPAHPDEAFRHCQEALQIMSTVLK